MNQAARLTRHEQIDAGGAHGFELASSHLGRQGRVAHGEDPAESAAVFVFGQFNRLAGPGVPVSHFDSRRPFDTVNETDCKSTGGLVG